MPLRSSPAPSLLFEALDALTVANPIEYPLAPDPHVREVFRDMRDKLANTPHPATPFVIDAIRYIELPDQVRRRSLQHKLKHAQSDPDGVIDRLQSLFGPIDPTSTGL